MTFEVGKHYKMRSDQVGKITEITDDLMKVEILEENGYVFNTQLNGSFLQSGEDNIWDLLDECDEHGNLLVQQETVDNTPEYIDSEEQVDLSVPENDEEAIGLAEDVRDTLEETEDSLITLEDIAGAHEMIESLTFGQAILLLKSGARVSRQGWNGKDMYLELQVPDEHSKMSLPYIYMKTACGNLVPWLASQTDILSDDWEVYYAAI